MILNAGEEYTFTFIVYKNKIKNKEDGSGSRGGKNLRYVKPAGIMAAGNIYVRTAGESRERIFLKRNNKEVGLLDTKELNDLKKKYLRQYLIHARKIERIKAEIAELELIKKAAPASNSGEIHYMHNAAGQDLSGYIAKIDEKERLLLNEIRSRVKAYDDIAARIKDLKDQNESDVLFYRYIKGMRWYEIADQMKFSESQIYRYHGKALKHFALPGKIKDGSE